MLHTFQSSTMCLRALITLRFVGVFLILFFFFLFGWFGDLVSVGWFVVFFRGFVLMYKLLTS